MEQKIHVLLVDDDYHWTDDLTRLFVLEPSLKLVGTATTAEDGIRKAEMLRPDVIMVNIDLPDGDAAGIQVIQQAQKTLPGAVIIGQMNNPDNHKYERAMGAGAKRVVLKSAVTTAEMISLIKGAWEEQRRAAAPVADGPAGSAVWGQAAPGSAPQGAPMQQPGGFPPPSSGFGYPPSGQPVPPPGASPTAPQQPQSPPPYSPFSFGQQPHGQQFPQSPYTPSRTGFPPAYTPPGSSAFDQSPLFGGNHSPFGTYSGGFGASPFAHGAMRQPPASGAPRIRTTCIAINSPKGGVGKSTLAKELAGAFAMVKIPTAPGQPEDRLKVVLVDMDLDYGNIASMLRLNPIPNIATWAEDINRRLEKMDKDGDKGRLVYAPDQFMPYLQTHAETGLKVLTAPPLPAQALDVSERVVEVVIDSLRNYFDIVILDTGNNTKDYTLVSLDKAQKAIIVSTTDIPTVGNVHALLDTLRAIHYPMDKLYLVINEASKRSEISIDDIVRVLDIPFLGTIPEDPRVKLANNKGELLVMGKETEFTHSIRNIGNQLVPVFGAKRRKPASGGGLKFDLFSFLKKK